MKADDASAHDAAAWRSARRAAALQHHPDRGGDARSLARALAEVDQRFDRTTSSVPSGPLVVRRALLTRARRTVSRLLSRAWAHRPGAPRWIDL